LILHRKHLLIINELHQIAMLKVTKHLDVAHPRNIVWAAKMGTTVDVQGTLRQYRRVRSRRLRCRSRVTEWNRRGVMGGQPLQCAEFFLVFEFRFFVGRFRDADGLVVDLQRYREWICRSISSYNHVAASSDL